MANEYGNYDTWNPLQISDAAFTLSNGNRTVIVVNDSSVRGGIAFGPTGKYYFEITCVADNTYGTVGISPMSDSGNLLDGGRSSYPSGLYGMDWQDSTGLMRQNNVTALTGSTWTAGDILGWYVDFDNDLVFLSKDGTLENSATQGEVEAGTATNAIWDGDLAAHGKFLTFCGCNGGTNMTFTLNTGQTAYNTALYSGYTGIATQNLPTPSVINYEDEYYIQAGISHSNGSTTAVTLPKTVSGGAMARIKRTDSSAGTSDWLCFDTIRGTNKAVKWNSQEAEDTSTYDDQNLTGTTLTLPSDLTTGTYLIEIFYIGSYFQVKTYTGSGANKTESYPASLGSLPGFMAVISRTATGTFNPAWHNSLTDDTYYLKTDTNAAQAAAATMWNSTAPSATVLALGSNAESNTNLNTYVAYIWANSGPYAWGAIEGNGNANGSMANVGGLPASVMAKSIDSTSSWYVGNIKNNPGNVANQNMVTNSTGAIFTEADWDILSNGFKFRIATDPNVAETYIYGTFGIQPMTDGGVNQGRAR